MSGEESLEHADQGSVVAPEDAPEHPENLEAAMISSPSTPRLAIQRLRLENFKSYGGAVDVGPFHKCFSSIVGPNGSGKSNVIDAMLFVFGHRAKKLRHSKLSELLHHSSTYPNVQSATVTVYFHEIVDTGDGDEDYEVVPNSEIAIARSAFRNNTSKYYLNGKEVKMSKVVELLKGKGVDLDHNRFLILQGEVEQIAMMKPKAQGLHEDGLLEYLEDIIGSNRHIAAIEESAKRVESLNEERSHKLNRVKAAERERDGLEDAKVEAEDYLDKNRDILTKKVKLNKAEQHDKSASLIVHREKLTEATKRVEEFQSSVQEKETLVMELEKSFNKTQKECDIAVKTMNGAKEKYAAFERKDIEIRENIKALKVRQKKLDGILKREAKRAENESAKAMNCLEEKAKAEEQLKETADMLSKVEKEFDNVRDAVRERTAPVRQRLEEKQTELLPFSETVNSCRKALQVNQSELKLLVEKLDAPRNKLQEAEKSLAEMEGELEKATTSLSGLEAETVNITKETEEQGKQMEQKRKLLEELSASCSRMRRRVEESRAANEDLRTRSRLHSGILQASRSGLLQGVVGRLGDLASTDSKYSTAVGAAAGANLDCIVVRTAENAQACIEFLRRENLGRATFVILEKIEYLRRGLQSDRSADGPRVFDFLRIPNPENATALYYALRDTLVADSLEDARRMAFKPTRQNRVVSLRGELIESSGAMTGGGRGPTRFRLGSSQTAEAQMDPAALQELMRELDSTQQKMSDERQYLTTLDKQKTASSSRLEELQVLLTKSALEVKSLQSRISNMSDNTLPVLRESVQRADQRAQKKKCPDTKRKLELEAAVHDAERELSEACEACEGLESEIAVLQEKIVAAGGTELDDAKRAVEDCRSRISDMQSTMARAASKAKAAEKASENARAARGAAEQEMETVREDIVKGKEMLQSMEDDAQKVLQKFKEAEAVHNEWVEKVHSVQAEFSDVKADLKRLKREEVSLTEEVAAVQRVVSKEQFEVRALCKDQASLNAKLKELSLLSVGELAEENDNQEGGEMDVDPPEPALDEQDRLSPEEKTQLSSEIGVLESELSRMTPNLGAIAEYQSKDSEYKSQVSDLETLTASRDTARKECDTLRKARLDEFMAGFSVITLKLKELYQMITLGGDAELELVDSLDPFSEGIVFSVRPPKKSWKNISNLSGGEKTLSSLALVFALHHFKPTPLYFLDEIDAALDYKNVSIVANYVKERTKNAQFIIISLRNNMFELADRLVGIYKTHNTTKSVTIDPGAFVIPTQAAA